jgi:FixJ family two-component response regulator
VTSDVDGHRPCVLLLEPNGGVRRALIELLTVENLRVVECESLEHVLQQAASGERCQVALIAWQSMEGLLADEHRPRLVQFTRRLQLVVMVPRRWIRLLEQSDLDLVGMVAKPFDADELLDALRAAATRSLVASSPA